MFFAILKPWDKLWLAGVQFRKMLLNSKDLNPHFIHCEIYWVQKIFQNLYGLPLNWVKKCESLFNCRQKLLGNHPVLKKYLWKFKTKAAGNSTGRNKANKAIRLDDVTIKRQKPLRSTSRSLKKQKAELQQLRNYHCAVFVMGLLA